MSRQEETSNPPHLKRVLGRWDLVLLFVVAVFNLNVVPSIAANGGVTIWLWIISIVLFFWPQGIAVIELSHRYPGEGGVYLWAKEEFGNFNGFLSGWCYWTNQMLYVPTVMLKKAGYAVTAVGDGAQALRNIQKTNFALAFLDVWMPELTGLEVLARVRLGESHPKVIIMTSDGTPDNVLRAIREQAYEYVSKPFPPKEAVELAERALKQNVSPPIEVISAKPHWVELLIPCTREAAERIQSFLMKLEADLPEDVRSTIGLAFRELVLNAVEWGGKLDPNRKVRIAYVRSSRMLLYRVADPGPGFSFKNLTHGKAARIGWRTCCESTKTQ